MHNNSDTINTPGNNSVGSDKKYKPHSQYKRADNNKCVIDKPLFTENPVVDQ